MSWTIPSSRHDLRAAVPVMLWVLLSLTTPAGAQQPDVLRLSLEEARARAAAASHRLEDARARAAAAEEAVGVRAAADRPILALMAGYTRTNHVPEFAVVGPGGLPRVIYPDIPDNYRTRLDLQWPIYSGGRVDALERAARAEASAAAADVAAAQADLRLEVTRAYWALVTAQSAAAVLERSLSRAQALTMDIRERFTAGFVAPNEVAAAEAQESRQRMLLIEVRNQRAMSNAELARLIGTGDLQQGIQPADALAVPDAGPSPLESLVAQARASRNERRALEQRSEAAAQQHLAAAAGTRPNLAVTSGIDYARPNPRIFPRAGEWKNSWDVGVAVSWAFWDGGRTDAEVRQAGNGVAAARARLAEFDSLLTLEIHQRLLEIESGRAAVTAAGDAVRAAEEALRVVNERYLAGVVPQADVRDADVVLLQAELDRTRAMAGVRLAEARLERALGR